MKYILAIIFIFSTIIHTVNKVVLVEEKHLEKKEIESIHEGNSNCINSLEKNDRSKSYELTNHSYTLYEIINQLKNNKTFILANYNAGSTIPIFNCDVETLNMLVKTINDSNSDNSFKLIGHTNSAGAAQKNKVLSEKRASDALCILTTQFNLDELKVSVFGLGEKSPIASNKTSEGRKMNSRLELIKNLYN